MADSSKLILDFYKIKFSNSYIRYYIKSFTISNIIEGPYQILQVRLFESEKLSDSTNENYFESDINLVNKTPAYSNSLKYQRSSICIGQSFNEVQETI